MKAFFKLYQNLDREGPGEAADVTWAMQVGNLAKDAHILDAACGSGADVEALLKAAPKGHVTGVEKHGGFVKEARARLGNDPRVDFKTGDMTQLTGPYDAIWCAGAVYFIGIETALDAWRSALGTGGFIAFSDACWWTDKRSKMARTFWREYVGMTDQAGIEEKINAAGYDLIAARRVSSQGWEDYYTSLEARIAKLRPDADAELAAVLDASVTEIATWRACSHEYGYLLSVVRPR